MIGDITSKKIYDITDVLTPLASGYEITFPYPDKDSIRVYTTGNMTDTEVNASDYTVDEGGATPKVVFSAGYSFPLNQTKLTIIRNLDYNQGLDLRNGDTIDADKLEEALDDITMQIQQIEEKVTRSVLSSVSDTVQIRIPEADSRANMLLGFDGSGAAVPVLTTDIEQKLAQALDAEESAITAKNAAEFAQHEAESARTSAETAQSKAEDAQASAEAAESSSQALLASIETKTEESISSINTTKTGAVGAVATQQATSVAAVQAAQNTAESDIAGKRASALTAIDSAKTTAVAAVNTQKETSVAAADRDIVAKRDSALTDIQTARTNAVNAITTQKDKSLQEIEQLASERKSEINSLAANQKADVKQYTDVVVAAAKTEIDTEKTTAVTAVQEEGATQVAAVQAVYADDYAELVAENKALKVKVASNSRQIENLNDRLDDDLIINKYKMTGETPDAPGVLSLPPSKLLPNAEVNEVLGKTRSTRNIWDETWEMGVIASYNGNNGPSDEYLRTVGFIPVQSGKTYYFKSPYVLHLRLYRADKSYIGTGTDQQNSTFTVTGECAYIRFVAKATSYSVGSICVNESDSMNGTYEPYFEGLKTAKLREVKLVGTYRTLLNDYQFNYLLDHLNEWHNENYLLTYNTDGNLIVLSLLDRKAVVVGENSTRNSVLSATDLAKYVNHTNPYVAQYLYQKDANYDIGSVGTLGIPSSPTHTITLPSLVLRSAGSVHDSYEPQSGKVTVNTKEYTFTGSESYTTYGTLSNGCKRVNVKIGVTDVMTNAVGESSSAPYVLPNVGYNGGARVISSNDDHTGFLFYSTKTDNNEAVAEAKEVLIGSSVCYPLAEPKDPTYVDPISPFISVEDGGTVSIVSDDAQAEAMIHYAIDNRSAT